MDIILKTAEQIRALMPQAKPEKYIEPILEEIERIAMRGGQSFCVFQSSQPTGINDIGLWAGGNGTRSVSATLAGRVANQLRDLGFTVGFEPGYTDPREPSPAAMIIRW